MNAKITAREIAASAGCPVLPGIHETLGDEDLMTEARKLGFPLMLKPVAGRDGKGMRLVKSPGELRRALPRVKGDALFSFWDERVYLEKALVHPRHIDLQVAGDSHGNYVYLWEREGSVQRRFQQVADEAPSLSVVTPGLRKAMGEAAVAVARKVGYVGLGTVEFLMDADGKLLFPGNDLPDPGRPRGHRVDHRPGPGASWQIQIARGEKLPLAQNQMPFWGHAVQCRINAEDPDRDFAPSSGRILYLRTPAGHRLRDDNGVYPGWELSPFYAPLLSKLSTWGPTRAEALERMHAALSEYRVGGVRTNVAFHKALLEHKPFLRGELHAGMLDHAWWKQKKLGPNLKFAVAAALFDELETGGAPGPAAGRARTTATAAGRHWNSLGRFNRL